MLKTEFDWLKASKPKWHLEQKRSIVQA